MATNFLDKAFSLIGLKSSSATDYYDPSVYKAEVSNSEVFNAISDFTIDQMKTAVTPPATTKQTSRVEQYLAAKQQPDIDVTIKAITEATPEPANEPEAVEKLTGVTKYLFTKQQEEQAALANMTGVAKYLYNLKNQDKSTPAKKIASEKKSTPVKLSRVDMYLAKKQDPALKNHTTDVSKKSLKRPPKTAPIIKTTQVKVETEKPAGTAKSNNIIDLTAGATQCQAATLKHTQCSRKTSLETMEKTLNQQRYKFTVCSQHNKDSFMPFEKFLQDD